MPSSARTATRSTTSATAIAAAAVTTVVRRPRSAVVERARPTKSTAATNWPAATITITVEKPKDPMISQPPTMAPTAAPEVFAAWKRPTWDPASDASVVTARATSGSDMPINDGGHEQHGEVEQEPSGRRLQVRYELPIQVVEQPDARERAERNPGLGSAQHPERLAGREAIGDSAADEVADAQAGQEGRDHGGGRFEVHPGMERDDPLPHDLADEGGGAGDHEHDGDDRVLVGPTLRVPRIPSIATAMAALDRRTIPVVPTPGRSTGPPNWDSPSPRAMMEAMAPPIDVDDVLRPQPTPGTLMRRGVLKHCPRCDGGHLYMGWFRMKERCPTCGYLFEREPGFFVGAYLINFAIVEGFLFILLMGFIAWKDQNPDAGMTVPIVVGLFIGVIGPVIFYPFSRTIWSALDLLMTPLEVGEIVAAADAVSDDPPTD